MSLQQPLAKPLNSIHEIRHLRNALARLEYVGETNCITIDNLKLTVVLRIAELEARLDSRRVVKADHAYDAALQAGGCPRW